MYLIFPLCFQKAPIINSKLLKWNTGSTTFNFREILDLQLFVLLLNAWLSVTIISNVSHFSTTRNYVNVSYIGNISINHFRHPKFRRKDGNIIQQNLMVCNQAVIFSLYHRDLNFYSLAFIFPQLAY